jgi:hypothetical protein
MALEYLKMADFVVEHERLIGAHLHTKEQR